MLVSKKMKMKKVICHSLSTGVVSEAEMQIFHVVTASYGKYRIHGCLRDEMGMISPSQSLSQ